MSQAEAAHVLTGLGFTGLESEIYAFLVKESPATGYRIAQAIGKPVANTYKAIQTLQSKGAIVVEEGDSRQCRAVPSEELLSRIGREFEAKRLHAKDLLGQIGAAAMDDRLYQLRSQSQVLQRAREMIGKASQIALIAAPKLLIEELEEELAAASARGVDVFAKSDEDLEIPRVETFVASRTDDLARSLSFFRMVVDGEQLLIAYLVGDAINAIWSRNPFIALPIHEGLAAEMSLLEVEERIADGAGAKRLIKALTAVPPASETPGFGKR